MTSVLRPRRLRRQPLVRLLMARSDLGEISEEGLAVLLLDVPCDGQLLSGSYQSIPDFFRQYVRRNVMKRLIFVPC